MIVSEPILTLTDVVVAFGALRAVDGINLTVPRGQRRVGILGLKAKIPLLSGWTAMDDALLKSLGDEAVGVVSAHWYSSDGQSAEV